MVAAIDPLIANRPVDVYGRRSLLERAAELKLLAGTVRTLGRQVSPALRALIPSPTRNTKVTYLVFRLQAKYDSAMYLQYTTDKQSLSRGPYDFYQLMMYRHRKYSI